VNWAPNTATELTLTDYVASMARAVFVSGINWKVIDAKWDGIRKAFDDFDPLKVAAYTPADIDRLMTDTRVIRNRKKIEAIVRNTGELIVVDREFGGIDNYLKSFDDNDLLIKDLHKRFAFLGESVAHFFLFGVNFNYPAQEAWAKAHFGGEHPHGR
jgi:3-methyladenine DNA glycosylase Tag